MTKIVRLLFVALLCPLFSIAQHVKEGTVKLGKATVPCFIATSKHDRVLVEEAIAAEFTAAGIKHHKKKKKFIVHREVVFPEISNTKTDLYYKVSKKKKKSRIYFVASRGYDNYVSSANDADMAAKITTFLGKIDAQVTRSEEVKQKEAEVKEADENIKKAEEERNKKAKELKQMQSPAKDR